MRLPAAVIATALLVSQVTTASREPALVVTEDRVELQVPFDTTGTLWDPGRSPEGMVGYACWVTMPMLGDTFGFGFAHGSRYPAGGMLTFRQLLDESRTTFWRSESGVHTPLAVDSLFVRLDADGFVVVLLDRVWAQRVLGSGRDSAGVYMRLPDEQRMPVPIVREADDTELRLARESYVLADSITAQEARRVYPARRVERVLLSLCIKGKVILFDLDGRQFTEEETRAIIPDRARAVMDSLEITSFALLNDVVYCTNVSVFRVDRGTGDIGVALQGSKVGEWWVYHYGLRMSSTGRYLAINAANGTGHVLAYDLYRERCILHEQHDTEFVWTEGLDFLLTPGPGSRMSGYEIPSGVLRNVEPLAAPESLSASCAVGVSPVLIGFVGDHTYFACGPVILEYNTRKHTLRQLVDAGDSFKAAFAALQYQFGTP